MSKTVSTCILETNQVQNRPQENVFFHTLYRTQADYPNEFMRTARSTSPIQICAIFSCIGPDNLGAVLNIELNEELGKIVASTQNQPVLDFEAFSNRVINVLNVKVCNYIVARGGTPLKVSMTMLIIEGDTLRVIHIGNTKAVLIRDNKIMALTEDQTVAHRYVQMGAITPEQELNHPENMTLTQYLGKMPQDGAITADRKVHLKLKDDDELCLMGLGIAKLMPAQMRNMTLIKPLQTENKARELITSAFNYGVKSGLSVVMIQIESTFLLPGDAIINSNLASDGTINKNVEKNEEEPYTSFNEPVGDVDEEDMQETQRFNRGNAYEDEEEEYEDEYDEYEDLSREKKEKKMKNKDNNGKKESKAKLILVPILIFILCTAIGFGAMFLLFNWKHIIDGSIFDKPKETQETENTLMYVINDNTPVYAEDSLESTVIATLDKGDSVVLNETTGSFAKITTSKSVVGYVLLVQISEEDPTLEEPDEDDEDEGSGAGALAALDPDVAPTTEETEAEETQAPAPAETQAPAPVETQAPVETEAEENQAPAETEAPAVETEAPAEEVEVVDEEVASE